MDLKAAPFNNTAAHWSQGLKHLSVGGAEGAGQRATPQDQGRLQPLGLRDARSPLGQAPGAGQTGAARLLMNTGGC